jgi:tripartite-type tricarboxylate transporter receptor subunit TctC
MKRAHYFIAAAAVIVPMIADDLAIHPALAQDWPTRPMTLVVPFSAGGSSDAIARIIADGISNNLHQPVVVENVTGVGGLLGGSRVAKSTPDGYQFVIGNVGTRANGSTSNRFTTR